MLKYPIFLLDLKIKLMSDEIRQFEARKQDHIKLALQASNQASECNPFDSMSLQHEALPELDFSSISLKTKRLGKVVDKPFFVSSMTGGHQKASLINRHLMEACEQSGWAMGVGSQRRQLFDKKAGLEWEELRAAYPRVSLFSNLGIAQLLDLPLKQIEDLTSSLQAEALIIHCNPLQEVLQPEGTPQFKGCLQALGRLIDDLTLPIIVKETGCGFSTQTLRKLNELGVAAVDVSGLGGTHWGRIEGQRALQDSVQARAAKTFKNWGIDTLQSVKNALSIQPNFEIWGSGGVRHGLDAAKLFALGVLNVGFAKPLLEAALESSTAVYELMMGIEYELRVAMFCTGSQSIDELKERAWP